MFSSRCLSAKNSFGQNLRSPRISSPLQNSGRDLLPYPVPFPFSMASDNPVLAARIRRSGQTVTDIRWLNQRQVQMLIGL
ncbi:MAG: hypothetical protein CMJ81_06360 [Planctomycetaceae bacterium]|nr:hypothetical protein [Planctomycetaceae bacterium]MBP60493.1 hypothetical protein [Planctomycetaceae bacterium]